MGASAAQVSGWAWIPAAFPAAGARREETALQAAADRAPHPRVPPPHLGRQGLCGHASSFTWGLSFFSPVWMAFLQQVSVVGPPGPWEVRWDPAVGSVPGDAGKLRACGQEWRASLVVLNDWHVL